ncbi:MAG: peptidoglycan-binding protein [Gemmataceae bacterium]
MALRNVMIGTSGPDVRAVQEGLNKFFQNRVLDPDGNFGPETDKVVRRFQQSQGMTPPDGIVGPITRSALFPLVAMTVNFYGTRSSSANVAALASGGGGGGGGARLSLSFGIPGVIPLPIPPGLLKDLADDEPVKVPGQAEPLPTPVVATPPTRQIVVDWQQVMQSQRQFDGLFKNQQDSFGVGWQSVFKRKQLDPNQSHLEIATGCLVQSPIGFQDGKGNDFTIACFAQATWVESLGQSGDFAWAPYATAQGQGNATGPANVIGSVALFPLALNIDLSKIGFNDVTLQAGGGIIGSLKFTPTGLATTWGPVLGFGLQGKAWFLGN